MAYLGGVVRCMPESESEEEDEEEEMASIMARQGQDNEYKPDLIEPPAELDAPGVIQFDELGAGAEEWGRKVDQGYVYDPLVRSLFDVAPFQLELPGSIWTHCALNSLARAGPRPIPAVHPGWPLCVSEEQLLSAVTVVLTFSIGIGQMYLSYAIIESTLHDENQMCEGGDHWVRLLCMFIFVLVMSDNAYASYQMARYVYEIPAWEDGMTAVLKKSDGFCKILYRSEDIPTPVGALRERLTVPVTGMSRASRAYINFCVAFKFVAELVVTIAGMGLIAHSQTNAELVANSVAVTFIADIDDISETALISPARRRILALAFPPIGLAFRKDIGDPRPGSIRRIDKIGVHSQIYQPLLIVAVVAMSAQLWCRDPESELGLLG